MRQRRTGKAVGWLLYSVTVLLCLLMPSCRRAESPLPAGGQASRAARQPPATPVLRIEAGMHTARIWRINVDAAERFLVTASEDKTARVWDLTNGQMLRILRPPLGVGHEGRLEAVAISLDGATVATGGWTSAEWEGAMSVYLFERASGRLMRRIPGLPNVIHHLAYSSDGRYLVAALGGKNGIRVYDARDGHEVARDSDYGGASYWAEFDRRGRLMTSCEDGFVRLYDANFTRIAQRQAPGGRDPFAVRFAPDGTEVAVGFDDTTAVNVLSGEDLSFRYAPDTLGVNNGALSTVAWSRDGRLLYAAGRYRDGTGITPIIQWSQAGRGAATVLAASTNTIIDLRPLAHGRLVFGAQDPAFGVFDANSTRVLARGPETVDYRNTALRVSDDGSVVEFAFDTLTSNNRRNRHLARLYLTEGQVLHNPQPLATGVTQMQQRLTELGYDPGPTDGTLGPRTRAAVQTFQRARGLVVDGQFSPALQRGLGIVELQAPRTTGLAIRDWYDSTRPTLDGTPLPLAQYEISRGLAIAPDGARFALGTEWSVRLFDQRGTQLWAVSVPSITLAVNISGDGRFVIAAFGDGTLRWYRLRDGAELLALFLHPDGTRWVLWTPEGVFHAAPGSETLIGYHLNQGADAAGEFVTVEQLATLFSRPELVARRLEEGIEPTLREALTRIGDVRQVLAGGLPPTLQLLSQPEIRQNQRDFTFEFRIVDKGGGVGRIVYRVNGAVVGDPIARPMDISAPHHRRPFTLSSERNVVSATIFNAKNTIESAPIETVVYVNAGAPPSTLYVLAVGITTYRYQDLNLRYAARDASAVAEVLQRQGHGLFKNVQVTLLLNEAATLHNLDAAFQKLAGEVQEHDVFVLYMAGHGATLDGEYLFIPWDMGYENRKTLLAGSVRQEQLMRWLGLIKAQKSLVLLDTCYAGALVKAAAGGTPALFAARGLEEKGAIDRLMRATGQAMLVASTDQQFALEGYDDQHGVFTYVLLQGLRGDALPGQSDTLITVDQLASYVMREVPRRTMEKWHQEQLPMQQISGQPFAIGRVQR